MSDDLNYLRKYKRIMAVYSSIEHFGYVKEDYELPFHLNMLKAHLISGNYEEAVYSLEDIVLCYDMRDPKVRYLTEDVLKECEDYVDAIIQEAEKDSGFTGKRAE